MLNPEQRHAASPNRWSSAGSPPARPPPTRSMPASRSSSVQVRLGELEDVSRSEGEEIGLRLFVGQRSATVASSDLSDEALGDAGRALPGDGAAKRRKTRMPDLRRASLLQRGELPLLDVDDRGEPDPAELRARALEAEKAALAVAGRHQFERRGRERFGIDHRACDLGRLFRRLPDDRPRLLGVGRSPARARRCSATMPWHSARHLEDLDSAAEIGRRAGERAVARLNPTRPKPGKYPVLFDPRVSSTLLGHFVGAISGSSIARKTSFLQDKLGEQVFAAGRDDRRRSAAAARAALAPVRRRGRARLRGGSWSRTASSTSGSPKARRRGSSASQPTGHAARGVGGAPGASPSNLYHGAGRAQPRGAARRLSRGRADRSS